MKIAGIKNNITRKIIQSKIAARNAGYEAKVVVSDAVNPETKAAIEANKTVLGRLLTKKRGSVTFEPVEDGLFKGRTEVTINKKVNTVYLGDSLFSCESKKPVNKTIIDVSKETDNKSFLKDLKKLINTYLDGSSENKFVPQKHGFAIGNNLFF